MNDITLLIMAAGMGSRYGGLKQLDSVGPSGETIIDYSVYDAIRAGFNKVVFIIRKDFEEDFRLKITNKYKNKIRVEFAFQDLNDLPEGFLCPEGRVKPWGTGHAILTASQLIHEPFVAINGDDFYGRESFEIVADYYQDKNATYSMVAFQLDKTLSEFGGVTRGLCTVKNDLLDTIVETGELKRSESGVSSDRDIQLDGSEPVSMNVWGFTPDLFDHLRAMFVDFLHKEGDEMKSEYLIPTIVNNLIRSGEKDIYVLRTGSKWFGVTYKEDKPFVTQQVQSLVDRGVYPKQLF
tara:strand:- start:14117 stop:14998 length:882 start_codon:yes stop_codon:yes gene_type:complete